MIRGNDKSKDTRFLQKGVYHGNNPTGLPGWVGAVGSAFAAQMNEAEPGLVKVIVDEQRYEAYRNQEVRVMGSPTGSPWSFRSRPLKKRI